MFSTLQSKSAMALALTVVMSAGTALADGSLVLYGTAGNCPAGSVCMVRPLVFGGKNEGSGSSNVSQTESTAVETNQPGHHGQGGGGEGGGGGHGGGGQGGGGHGGGQGGGGQGTGHNGDFGGGVGGHGGRGGQGGGHGGDGGGEGDRTE